MADEGSVVVVDPGQLTALDARTSAVRWSHAIPTAHVVLHRWDSSMATQFISQRIRRASKRRATNPSPSESSQPSTKRAWHRPSASCSRVIRRCRPTRSPRMVADERHDHERRERPRGDKRPGIPGTCPHRALSHPRTASIACETNCTCSHTRVASAAACTRSCVRVSEHLVEVGARGVGHELGRATRLCETRPAGTTDSRFADKGLDLDGPA
jgi:hypothetical protein